MSKEEADLIVVDPEICAGKPVIKGTRVPVEYIVHLARKGFSQRKIAEEFDLPEDLINKIVKVIERTPTIKFA